jgi:hypothetical protein
MATESWTTISWTTGFGASDLNSLGNGTLKTSTGSIIDNTSSPKTNLVVRFTAGASLTATSGGHLLVFLWPSYDGTNYISGTDGATASDIPPWFQYPNIGIGLRAIAAQENQLAGPIENILPLKYKLAVINRAGVALPSSGNAIDYALVSRVIS